MKHQLERGCLSDVGYVILSPWANASLFSLQVRLCHRWPTCDEPWNIATPGYI